VTPWVFEVGAGFYDWLTAQRPWRRSCRVLAERLPPSDRPLRIVDLGCGPGASALELAHLRPRDFVWGVDIAWRMLRRARQRAARNKGGHLAWIRADAAHLPFADGSVDCVTGHSVVYLLSDQRAVLAECRRILRRGGRLLLMEPSDRRVRVRDLLAVSRDPRFLLSVALWRPMSWLHGRFAPGSLEATLRAAGFGRCDVTETLSGLGLCARADKT
jgi:ubiquinone/menaquinone biosynthesis C-methylase UbiE